MPLMANRGSPPLSLTKVRTGRRRSDKPDHFSFANFHVANLFARFDFYPSPLSSEPRMDPR